MVEAQTFAYLRVSKMDQDIEKNKIDILKLANNEHLDHVHFVEEKVSGKISWRKRQIATLLENAREGDSIIVSELSRLGRSTLECIEIFNGKRSAYLCRQRQLEARYQHPEQNHCHGLRDCSGN